MRAVVFVLIASALFGTTGTAQHFGAAGVDVVSLGAARIVVGGTALAVVALALRRRGRATPAIETTAASRRTQVLAVLLGGIGVIAYQPTFFLGTERNGIAIGTLVALGSAPLFTGAVSWALTRRFPGARWAVATATALMGLALLGGGAGPTEAGMDPVGLAGSLGAGLSYAIYTLASKRLLDAGWAGSSAMGAVFGTAAVFGIVVLLGTDMSWLATGPGAAATAWLGLATVLLAYLFFAAGLTGLSAPTVSTLTLAEPLTATLLGVLIVGERLEASSVAGLVALAVGIAILAIPARRERREHGSRVASAEVGR